MLKMSDVSNYFYDFFHCYKVSHLLSWSILSVSLSQWIYICSLVHSQVHLRGIPANLSSSRNEHVGGTYWERSEMALPQGQQKEERRAGCGSSTSGKWGEPVSRQRHWLYPRMFIVLPVHCIPARWNSGNGVKKKPVVLWEVGEGCSWEDASLS